MLATLSEAATIAAQAPAISAWYLEIMLGLGALILLVAWLPVALNRMALSLPIVCVAIGVAIFTWTPLSEWAPHPDATPKLVERASELIVIVSLMGAGLKMYRPIGWKSWNATWRLLGIAMPLTIALVMLLGHYLLGLGLATALLLAGALAPTDPVLAGDVQVSHDPDKEEAEAKFALTSEAGLNDALAFPFVHLAIMIALAGGLTASVAQEWAIDKVLVKIGVGAAMGAAFGWLIGWLTYRLPADTALSRTGDGFVALGVTLAGYALTEFAGGYGFLAVFVAGVMIRRAAQGHDFNKKLHDFADEAERLLMMFMLLMFGGMIAGGLLADIGWEEAVFAAAMLLVIRPVAAWISLIGFPRPRFERGVIAFFGIRGLGSVYYLSYGFNHAAFDYEYSLWGTLGLIILSSIVMHGVLVTPAFDKLGKRYRFMRVGSGPGGYRPRADNLPGEDRGPRPAR